jgi:hypothetical protein
VMAHLLHEFMDQHLLAIQRSAHHVILLLVGRFLSFTTLSALLYANTFA